LLIMSDILSLDCEPAISRRMLSAKKIRPHSNFVAL
jgi:hypothetical protein